jgi:hypothetical protein
VSFFLRMLMGPLRRRRGRRQLRTHGQVPAALAYALTRFADSQRERAPYLVDELLTTAFARLDAAIDEDALDTQSAGDLLFLRHYFFRQGDWPRMAAHFRSQAMNGNEPLDGFLDALCESTAADLCRSLETNRTQRLRMLSDPPAIPPTLTPP